MVFRRTVLLTLYKLSDIVILILSLAFSTITGNYLLNYGIISVAFYNLFPAQFDVYQLLIIIIIIESWHIIFKVVNLYRSRRFGSKLQECLDILKATTFGTCIISIFVFFYHPTPLSAIFILIFWATSTFMTITARMTMRLILKIVRNKGRNLRFIVIAGTNEKARSFANEIRECKELGYKLVGFVDSKSHVNDHNKELLSDLDHFSEVLNRYIVDEVVIALPFKSHYEQIENLARICTEQGIVVRYLADLFDQQLAKSSLDDFHGAPLLTIYNGPKENWTFIIKRTIDAVLSFLGLILLFPIFIIVAILIKIDSPGPVFFVQERVGYNKRRFNIYKFRTMINEAEKKQSGLEYLNEMDGPVFKIAKDPRITRIGKFLRKTSIDELPQLFTVLKGDMSLVGPRPLPVRDYNGFDVECHKRRFSVRPGVTCLWQVNGRNELPFQKWMELDMEYIDNWSLLLDLKILLKTIPAVLKCSGSQ